MDKRPGNRKKTGEQPSKKSRANIKKKSVSSASEENRQKNRTGNRTKTGQFMPGVSGNPKGRPKDTPEQKELKARCKELSNDAVEVLASILKDKGAKESDRIRAAEAILNRGYGMPKQSVDLENAAPQVVFFGDDDVPD